MKQTLFLDQQGILTCLQCPSPLVPQRDSPQNTLDTPLYIETPPNKHTYKNTTVRACLCVSWGCLCTHWTTYINPRVGQFSAAAHEGALFLKRGTGFKPEAPIKEKCQPLGSKARFPTLKLHIPSLNPELKPQTLPNLNPKKPCFWPSKPPPSPLFASLPSTACGTYPCRCHGHGPHHCHSCTPGLYGGHRAVLRGNPGWAERHTPCSSRRSPELSWPLGGRMEALLDTHTPWDSQQSPTGRDIGHTLV